MVLNKNIQCLYLPSQKMTTPMFKPIIILFLYFLITGQMNTFAQSIHIKHPIDSTALSQKSATTSSSTKTIDYYDAFISAIEIKIEAVQNNPESHQKALSNGWYEQINRE
jgi:hypothetical protein